LSIIAIIPTPFGHRGMDSSKKDKKGHSHSLLLHSLCVLAFILSFTPLNVCVILIREGIISLAGAVEEDAIIIAISSSR